VLIIICEDDFQGCVSSVYLGCEMGGIRWVARRGSRGWRGVIDRPGREDFKVSETSHECDRGAKKHTESMPCRVGGRICGRKSEQNHNSKCWLSLLSVG
jgi:hypothetical protein